MMLATEFLTMLRGRGFGVRLAHPATGPMQLFVRPASRLTDQDRRELQSNKPALVALLEAEAAAPTAPLRLWEPAVMTALEVFPGAEVIAHNVPAVWPPEGGWIPSPTREVPAEVPATTKRR